MKKITSIALCFLLLMALAVPVMAAGMKVVFTAGSSFVAGGTVTVDELATKHAIMGDPSVTSDLYNAALEGNIQFYWFRNDSYYADGPSLSLTDADKGCRFFCRAFLFSDEERTQQCGFVDSDSFTVPKDEPPAPSTEPTEAPTTAPTEAPTTAPTEAPTEAPTTAPTEAPTTAPTTAPTVPTTGATQPAPTQPTPTQPAAPPEGESGPGWVLILVILLLGAPVVAYGGVFILAMIVNSIKRRQ